MSKYNSLLFTIIYFLFLFQISFQETTFQELYVLAKNYSREILKEELRDLHHKEYINQTCYDSLNNAFTGEDSDLFLEKLFADSSRNLQELGSYTNCFLASYTVGKKSTKKILNDVTFIVIQGSGAKDKDKKVIWLNYTVDEYFIGACVPRNCSIEEYEILFKNLKEKVPLMGSSLPTSEIKVYNLKETEPTATMFLSYIPIIIIIFLFLMSFFNSIPKKVFSICLKKRSPDIKQKIQECFSLRENYNQIMAKLPNDIGLGSLKGIRAIAMILIIFSNAFMQIFFNPIRVFNREYFGQKNTSLWFLFVVDGIKIGKRILYGVSGFILMYKMINYLDRELEKNVDESINSRAVSMEQTTNELPEVNLEDVSPQHLTSLVESYDKYSHRLTFKTLSNFWLLQLYKYIIYIFAIIFFKYSLINPIQSLFPFANPIWIYCSKTFLDKYYILNHVLTHAILINSFSDSTYFKYDPFIIANNEIFFFLISSTMIFYSYKKNFRMDLLIIFIVVLLQAIKLVMFLFLKNYNEFFPAMVYQENNFSFILSNPIYNYTSYVIGLFFGLINYRLQITGKINSPKNFLYLPKSMITFYRQKKIRRQIAIILTSLILIFCFFSFFIFINIFNHKLNSKSKSKSYSQMIENFYGNEWLNFYALYEGDIAVVCLLFLVILLFLSGDNPMSDFLSSDYWNLISRPYWTYLTTMEMMSFFIFYLAENRIKVGFVNVLFFWCTILMLYIIVGIFLFLFSEVPLKNFNKLLLDSDEEHIEQKMQ